MSLQFTPKDWFWHVQSHWWEMCVTLQVHTGTNCTVRLIYYCTVHSKGSVNSPFSSRRAPPTGLRPLTSEPTVQGAIGWVLHDRQMNSSSLPCAPCLSLCCRTLPCVLPCNTCGKKHSQHTLRDDIGDIQPRAHWSDISLYWGKVNLWKYSWILWVGACTSGLSNLVPGAITSCRFTPTLI